MYMSDLACFWDEVCVTLKLTIRCYFPCQSEACASCCSGFRDMLSPYLTLTRCKRGAISMPKPMVMPKLPTSGEKTKPVKMH